MIFDVLTILLVFALGSRIHNRWVGLLAALFYAAAPLAIQKAHFGTVNAVSSFLVALALYYAVGVQQRGKMGSYLMFGVACGAAVASRINLAPLAGIVIIAAFVQAIPAFDGRLNREERIRIVTRAYPKPDCGGDWAPFWHFASLIPMRLKDRAYSA